MTLDHPKLDLQTEPRALKNEDLYPMPKSISLEASLEATDLAFGRKNGGVLSTCREMHTVLNASSIFRGCTVRFACFYNRGSLRFTTKNSPRHDLFTCCIKPPAKTAKRHPRILQKGSRNPPPRPSEALQRCLRNWPPSKITFCAGNPPGDL